MGNEVAKIDKKNMVRGITFDNEIYEHFEAGIANAINASYTIPSKFHNQYVYHTQIIADAEVRDYVFLRLKSIKDTIICSIKSILASIFKIDFDKLDIIRHDTEYMFGGVFNLVREYCENAIYTKDKRELNDRFINTFYSYLCVDFVGDIYRNIMDNARAYIYSNPKNIDLFSENPTNTSLDKAYICTHNIVSSLIHSKFDEYANELTYITKYVIDAYANVYIERNNSNENRTLNFDDEF